MTEPQDELAKRRLAAGLAQQIATVAYQLVDSARQMGALGMTFHDVAEAVWDHLSAEDKALVPQDTFSDFMGYNMEVMVSLFMRVEGETEEERLKRQIGTMCGPEVMAGAPSECQSIAGKLSSAVDRIAARITDPIAPTDGRMRGIIRNLLKSESAAQDGETRAIECYVVLTGGITINGSLAEMPDGTLKMMSPAGHERGMPVFAEQFFLFADVVVIALKRHTTLSSSSPIILG